MHGLDTRIRSCNIIATVLLGFLVFGQRFSLETRTAPVYPSILCCLCCANYLLYLRQEQLACVFAVTIGIFLASFGVPRSNFVGVPDLMAVQLNVASGNENTQGLWRGTVPDGSAKHRGSLGNGKFDQGRWFIMQIPCSGLSFAGWGQRSSTMFNKVFFHIPKNSKDRYNTFKCFGCIPPQNVWGIFREWWSLNQLVGGNGREDWSGHMAHWYCHVGLCSITARLAENGVVDVVLWGAAISWWTGIKTRSKML